MSVNTLLKKLAKDGFSVIRFGNGYKVMKNHMLGSFSTINGRPINLYTINARVATEYNEGYQPGTMHYSCTRFMAALKEV